MLVCPSFSEGHGFSAEPGNSQKGRTWGNALPRTGGETLKSAIRIMAKMQLGRDITKQQTIDLGDFKIGYRRDT